MKGHSTLFLVMGNIRASSSLVFLTLKFAFAHNVRQCSRSLLMAWLECARKLYKRRLLMEFACVKHRHGTTRTGCMTEPMRIHSILPRWPLIATFKALKYQGLVDKSSFLHGTIRHQPSFYYLTPKHPYMLVSNSVSTGSSITWLVHPTISHYLTLPFDGSELITAKFVRFFTSVGQCSAYTERHCLPPHICLSSVEICTTKLTLAGDSTEQLEECARSSSNCNGRMV